MGCPESLWFLAPGLAHQLGNALFTLHGRAQLLPAAREPLRPDDRQAILDGVERARACLQVLRWLLDEPGQAPAHAVLGGLGELLRVPLRDRGLSFELHAPAGPLAVAPGPVARLVAAVCRRMAALALPGPGGALRLELLPAGPGAAALEFALLPAPGALPFPLDREHVLEPVQGELLAAQARPDPAPPGRALRLLVPASEPTLSGS